LVQFKSTILKFAAQGEKTGWSYIKIPLAVTQQLKPGHKKSFRVKGRIDDHLINGLALIPMGRGDFIMALNAELRRAIGKRKGDKITVQLLLDERPLKLSAELVECLKDEPEARHFFNTLPPSHQHYFSKWIKDARTETTKTKRIAQTITALSRKFNFGQMIRYIKQDRDDLLKS
jgi:hypothetical protein